MFIPVYERPGRVPTDLLDFKEFSLLTANNWKAPPGPNYTEILLDQSGLTEVSDVNDWYLVFRAKQPNLVALPDGREADAASHAR